MFRKLPGAMTRNNFLHDFLVHKTPRPIASCALFVRKKLFDVIIIQGTHAVSVVRANLAVARREDNAPSLAANVEHSTVETAQHGGAAHRRRAINPIDSIRLTFKTAQALE